ncbi:MAG: molybdenum cofactor guanylyltransferase [Gordonia sp. (in: high G+C Gram-positive bacteria)]
MNAHTQQHLNLAGIILAGGRSRRMGEDKAAMDWEGRPLISTVVDVVEQRCDPVLVAASESSRAYTGLFEEGDRVQWITGETPNSGPLGGLAAALATAAAAGLPAAFVCATDMPLIEPELIDELLHGLTTTTDVVIAQDAERDHPMAGIYRTRIAPQLAELVAAGELRMLGALDSVVAHRVGVSDPRWLTNVNAPEDVHRLRSA